MFNELHVDISEQFGILRQISYCIGGSFNMHIWAWSASPSGQVGEIIEKANSVCVDRCHIFFTLEISYLYPVNEANSYFILIF